MLWQYKRGERVVKQARIAFKPNSNLDRLWAKEWKIWKGKRGGARVFPHAVPSTSSQLACLLLNQTAWLVLVLWVLTPPPLQLRNSLTLCVSCLSGWRPGHFTPRRHIGRDTRGGVERRRKAQDRRTEGRLAGRRQRERHWTLPSWDWFTSLTEITSLTYKPEVKISH